MNNLRQLLARRFLAITVAVCGPLILVGCGTTRSSDTLRTATEQLLISDAIDRAVSALDITPLNGQSVFLDDRYLNNLTDSNYLISSVRQHLLGNGCMLQDTRDKADFIVEARAGAIGTNRHDLLFGIPSMNLPQLFPIPGIPTAIPEVPIAKRRDQRGVAKVALFAYQRETGLPVWQSGIAKQESTLNDVWLLGAGPFQGGTIRQGPSFAGESLESISDNDTKPSSLAKQSTFASPALLAGKARRLPRPYGEIVFASHDEPVDAKTLDGGGIAPSILVPTTEPADLSAIEPTQRMEAAIELPVTSPDVANQSGWFYSAEKSVFEPKSWQRNQVVVPQPECLVPLPQPIIDLPE